MKKAVTHNFCVWVNYCRRPEMTVDLTFLLKSNTGFYMYCTLFTRKALSRIDDKYQLARILSNLNTNKNAFVNFNSLQLASIS